MERLLGVRYRYAELPEAAVPAKGRTIDLSSLPEPLRMALCQAAVSLDQEASQQIVNQIRKMDVPLSEALERLIRDYRYDQILAHCDNTSP
jgi:hypothetical protein